MLRARASDASGTQIGYLPAERAPWISGKIKMDEDIRAISQLRTEHGALIRRPPLPQARIDRSGGSQLPKIEPEDVPDYRPPDH